jgi:hypothetical protein
MRKKPFLALLVLLTVLAVPALVAAAQKIVYTEDMIRQMFADPEEASAHDIMMRQRARLRELQDAFLLGDAKSIEVSADHIAKDMAKLPKALKPEKDTTETWRAMTEIVSRAEDMKRSIELKEYRAAYEHYANLQGQCVRCHQAVRDWGMFEEPAS